MTTSIIERLANLRKPCETCGGSGTFCSGDCHGDGYTTPLRDVLMEPAHTTYENPLVRQSMREAVPEHWVPKSKAEANWSLVTWLMQQRWGFSYDEVLRFWEVTPRANGLPAYRGDNLFEAAYAALLAQWPMNYVDFAYKLTDADRARTQELFGTEPKEGA